jgi:hypothetical protein
VDVLSLPMEERSPIVSIRYPDGHLMPAEEWRGLAGGAENWNRLIPGSAQVGRRRR